MGRKRSIHTDITSDGKLEMLAEEFGPLHCLVYTWAIPHAEDSGRLDADPRKFRNTVLAALKSVVTVEQVRQIIAEIASVRDDYDRPLWTLETDEQGQPVIAFPAESWFKHQSYIPKNKRDGTAADTSDASQPSPTSPQNAEKHRKAAVPPQNPVSPSPSPSLSPSPPTGGAGGVEAPAEGSADAFAPTVSEQVASDRRLDATGKRRPTRAEKARAFIEETLKAHPEWRDPLADQIDRAQPGNPDAYAVPILRGWEQQGGPPPGKLAPLLTANRNGASSPSSPNAPAGPRYKELC
jgi:hypothetical protein